MSSLPSLRIRSYLKLKISSDTLVIDGQRFACTITSYTFALLKPYIPLHLANLSILEAIVRSVFY